MDMYMCATWVGGLPRLCPGISKSLVTLLKWTTKLKIRLLRIIKFANDL